MTVFSLIILYKDTLWYENKDALTAPPLHFMFYKAA